MNNIEDLLNKVNNKILNEECVKEYFRLKKIIESDEQILNLEKKAQEHQKLMCQNKNNDEIYFKEKALYEKYTSELESNPIVQNFNLIKKEVNSLLIDIRDFLS